MSKELLVALCVAIALAAFAGPDLVRTLRRARRGAAVLADGAFGDPAVPTGDPQPPPSAPLATDEAPTRDVPTDDEPAVSATIGEATSPLARWRRYLERLRTREAERDRPTASTYVGSPYVAQACADAQDDDRIERIIAGLADAERRVYG